MANTTKALGSAGLTKVWSIIKENFVAKVTGKDLSTNDFTDSYKSALDNLSTDLSGKADVATTIAGYGITDAYTKTETDSAINTALGSVYKIKGTIAFADLPTSDVSEGDTYNISDAFTSTDAFKDGAGVSYPAGTNVYYTSDGMWDAMAGTYDLSEYLTADDIADLTDEEISGICTLS